MPNGGDPQSAGVARQRLKIRALGYVSARHGVDAEVDLALAGLKTLCQTAIEFVGALAGEHLKNRRLDLYMHGNSEILQLAAIAYASARHGIDADVGMAREGLALLCQAAIDFVESLPREDLPKRQIDPRLQIGNSVGSGTLRTP